MAKFTTEQLANIQIDYGIVYVDYGELTERILGPTRGGATFAATQQIRDIEFDGRVGKTKGMQNIDFIDAMLTLTTLAISESDLEVAMPYLTRTGSPGAYVYTCDADNLGMVPDSDYFKNITVFGKKTGGNYLKISVYNAMNEAPFSLGAVPKGEGTVNLEINGHWESDIADEVDKLFDITTVETLGADITPPTVTTTPADAAIAVAVADSLTALFSEAIREVDISLSNFILLKVSDATIVAGELSYNSTTKTATFTPTSNLDASTDYIWTITNVRDLAGNAMATAAANFTTA